MLNLHELNVFIEAALAQNFSVAARRLYLSQPAVSLHIRNLERQLDVQLFERRGRKIALSEAGRVMLPLAQDAVQRVKRIEETIAGLHGMVMGALRIACTTTAGKYILPRLVFGFRRLYPEVRVSISIVTREAGAEALLAGQAEIALFSALPSKADLEFRPFLQDHVVLITPPNHEWADGRTIQPADLLETPFIQRESTAGTHEMLVEELAAHGLDIAKMQTVLTLANAEAIEMSVEAGLGAAFVSRLAAERGLLLGRVVEVPIAGMDLTRAVYMARAKRHAGTPLQKAFWDYAFEPCNDEIRQMPAIMPVKVDA